MVTSIDLLKSDRKKNKDKNKASNETGNVDVSISEIDGMDIESYGKKYRLSLDEIKQKIKNKELISRSERGEIYIYDESDEYDEDFEEELLVELKDINVSLVDEPESRVYVDKIEVKSQDKEQEVTTINAKDKLSQPDLKVGQEDIKKGETKPVTEVKQESLDIVNEARDVKFQNQVDSTVFSQQAQPSIQTTDIILPSVSNVVPDSTMGYLAILAENLKISKQEQIELLKLTQESIKRVVDSTEKLVASKEALIEEKDRIIESLQTKIDEFSSIKYKLLQENEDLKTLVEALELSTKR